MLANSSTVTNSLSTRAREDLCDQCQKAHAIYICNGCKCQVCKNCVEEIELGIHGKQLHIACAFCCHKSPICQLCYVLSAVHTCTTCNSPVCGQCSFPSIDPILCDRCIKEEPATKKRRKWKPQLDGCSSRVWSQHTSYICSGLPKVNPKSQITHGALTACILLIAWDSYPWDESNSISLHEIRIQHAQPDVHIVIIQTTQFLLS